MGLSRMQKFEAMKLMEWLDKRPKNVNTLRDDVEEFNSRWERDVGPLELMSEGYKKKIMRMYRELRHKQQGE